MRRYLSWLWLLVPLKFWTLGPVLGRLRRSWRQRRVRPNGLIERYWADLEAAEADECLRIQRERHYRPSVHQSSRY